MYVQIILQTLQQPLGRRFVRRVVVRAIVHREIIKSTDESLHRKRNRGMRHEGVILCRNVKSCPPQINASVDADAGLPLYI